MKSYIHITIVAFLIANFVHVKAQNSTWEISLPEAQTGISYDYTPTWPAEKVMHWNTGEAGNELEFEVPKGKLKAYKYLICEVYHTSEYSLRVGFNFFRKNNTNSIELQGGENTSEEKNKPVIGVKIGVIPQLKTNVVFPLSHLDAQQVFLNRNPRQLKGTVSGSRIAPEQVSSFSIEINPFKGKKFNPELQIKRIYFSETLPKPLEKPEKPVVDEFGQWAVKDYKGKVVSSDDLVNQLKRLEKIAEDASFPEDWSQYGGWKEKKFDATGFFHVKKEGEK